MTRELDVTLDWQGPYSDVGSIPQQAGIYMILSGKKNTNGQWDPVTYKILDIGQSGRTGKRLADHDRETCWNDNVENDAAILMKYALMPTAEYSEKDRRAVECCLRAHSHPLPCGTECNSEYALEESVTVNNKGKYRPLRRTYICAGAEE